MYVDTCYDLKCKWQKKYRGLVKSIQTNEYLIAYRKLGQAIAEAVKRNTNTGIIRAFVKYANFNGRACRKEFWVFVTFLVVTLAALLFADRYLGTAFPIPLEIGGVHRIIRPVGLLSVLGFLVFLTPLIAVAIRRLHDIRREGWWLLIILVPVLGFLTLLFWFCQDSQPRDNRYGSDPKQASHPKGIGIRRRRRRR